ncbi:MAG: DUF6577 family protein [Balneolaceae bacterium]|nr:DUF6577 family protein [Balneolaceae bacterium]
MPIASQKLHIGDLQEYFSNDEILKTKDIADFYRKYDEDLKNSTINWRVYKLVKNGALQRIGRGVFKLGQEQQFKPQITKELKSLNKRLNDNYRYLQICIWNTSILNEFSIHQAAHFLTLVEVEEEAVNSVFQFLKERKLVVFKEPDEEMLTDYLPGNKEAYIVQSLISEAPLQEVNGIQTATLEKVLVDIFCDEVTFFAYQGSERSKIFKNAFSKYTINQNTLLRYARRRGKRNELANYLEQLKLLAVTNI